MYSYENTRNYPDDWVLSTSMSTAWSTHWIELLQISRKGIYDFTQFLISTEKIGFTHIFLPPNYNKIGKHSGDFFYHSKIYIA